MVWAWKKYRWEQKWVMYTLGMKASHRVEEKITAIKQAIFKKNTNEKRKNGEKSKKKYHWT